MEKAVVGRADYVERKIVRMERLRARAERAASEGSARIDAARRVGAMIPMGQPILVGHHSERRHRRDIARIDASYRAGFAALERAKELTRRAEAAERSRAISSDDPSAAELLRAKIEKIEKDVVAMKDANKRIRAAKGDKAKGVASLIAGGFSPARAEQLWAPDFAGRVGFAPYELTNRGAEIRRLKQRLAVLAQAEVRGEIADEKIGEIVIRDADNRTQIVFPGKPSEAVRGMLKSRGFRWAPSVGAWQRMSSEQARYAAREIAKAA